MIWVTWRQHRTENLLAAALLAAFASVMLVTGLRIASAYHDLGVGACLGATQGTQHCQDAVAGFNRAVGSFGNVIGWANFLPFILGVLLAAPLILDLESGTYRFAWMQSITRTRWILVKLALIAVAATLVGMLLALVFSWWRMPFDHLSGSIQPNEAFDFEGIAPIGYILFAISLVVASGTLIRRTIPAIGLSFVVFLVTRVGVQTYLRPHFLAPLKKVVPATGDPSIARGVAPQAWVLSNGFSDKLGNVLSDRQVFALMDKCMARLTALPKGSKAMQDGLGGCMRSHHIYNYVIYQPAGRFWTLQGIEFALYAAISAVLLGLTAWWVRERIG